MFSNISDDTKSGPFLNATINYINKRPKPWDEVCRPQYCNINLKRAVRVNFAFWQQFHNNFLSFNWKFDFFFRRPSSCFLSWWAWCLIRFPIPCGQVWAWSRGSSPRWDMYVMSTICQHWIWVSSSPELKLAPACLSVTSIYYGLLHISWSNFNQQVKF